MSVNSTVHIHMYICMGSMEMKQAKGVTSPTYNSISVCTQKYLYNSQWASKVDRRCYIAALDCNAHIHVCTCTYTCMHM